MIDQPAPSKQTTTSGLSSQIKMQGPRALSLRIDTNVGPSIYPLGTVSPGPSSQDIWRTPVTPNTPGLLSQATSASNQTPITPASRAPWSPVAGGAGSPGSCDIDILSYPNVVHAGVSYIWYHLSMYMFLACVSLLIGAPRSWDFCIDWTPG
jgi:hypothetical protein